VAARDRSRAGQLSFSQLEQLWQQAGGRPSLAPTMAAIALAESSGRTDAVNDNPSTGDYSVGPWQINYFGDLAASRTRRYGSPAQLIRDPLRDAKAAVDLAGATGQGLGNWSTYNSGAYRRYLGGATDAYGSRGTRPGAGGVTGFLGGLAHDVASPFESAWNDTVGAIGSVTDFLKVMAWLVNPLTWLRAVEFLAGFVLMVLGLFYYGSAAAGRSPASKNVPLAKLPGLGPIATGIVKGLQGTQKIRKKRQRATARTAAAATRGQQATARAATARTREQRSGELHAERLRTERARQARMRPPRPTMKRRA